VSVTLKYKTNKMMNATHDLKTHTAVTVTTDPDPMQQSLEIRLNIGYFKQLPGIIKLVQLGIGILCMACAAPALQIGGFGLGSNHWFLFVVVTCFIVTLIWTFFYLLQVRDFIKVKLPFTFLKIEVIYTFIATILYFIAFIVILSAFGWCTTSYPKGTDYCDVRVAAGVFGIFNTIAYGFGAYLVYSEYGRTPPELQ